MVHPYCISSVNVNVLNFARATSARKAGRRLAVALGVDSGQNAVAPSGCGRDLRAGQESQQRFPALRDCTRRLRSFAEHLEERVQRVTQLTHLFPRSAAPRDPPSQTVGTRLTLRFVVRNFVCVIDDIRPESSLVETELFPRDAIEFYTAKNMG